MIKILWDSIGLKQQKMTNNCKIQWLALQVWPQYLIGLISWKQKPAHIRPKLWHCLSYHVVPLKSTSFNGPYVDPRWWPPKSQHYYRHLQTYYYVKKNVRIIPHCLLIVNFQWQPDRAMSNILVWRGNRWKSGMLYSKCWRAARSCRTWEHLPTKVNSQL